MKHLKTSLLLIVAWALMNQIAAAQGTLSSLSGSVTDQTGAVLANARITAKNEATGAAFQTVSAENGTFTIPTMPIGAYTVTVAAQGFKQAALSGVELITGVPAGVRVTLEIGAANETVTIQGGGEIVQSQSATVSTTLNVNQISQLPLVSRNPVNFVVLMAGVNTTSNNRGSRINGLPAVALDVTIDGINVHDNFNKTNDGFFSRVAPSIDSVQEVTVSTSAQDAQSGGAGGAQIKFTTRQGTNEFHGSLYEYHRNPALNSAYWFTNRDTTPVDQATGKACDNVQQAYDPDQCRAPRARLLFNQYGGRLGGPVLVPKLFNGRNQAFFFVNYEELRQPAQISRQRTIFNPLTQAGVFQYNRTVNGVTQVQQVNLLTLAAANNQTATIDPTIGKLLADIRNATNGTGGIAQLTDPNLQRFTFNASANLATYRPTVRFDLNLTERHHLELSWLDVIGRGGPDFLGNNDPKFPGFPSQGGLIPDRYTGALAVRSTLSNTLVNEARVGLSGGASRFTPEATLRDYHGTIANQAGFNLGSGTPGGLNNTGLTLAAGIDGATSNQANSPSRRNPLLWDYSDTLSWTRGAHSFSFGGKFTVVNLVLAEHTLAPTINFGVNANDPATALFNTTNFPGASAANLTAAQNIYAVLTGRVIAINAEARLNEKTGQYAYLGNAVERLQQRETGLFAQDNWRARPNLTLSYGLRWQVQGAYSPRNDSYSTTTINDLFGVSGAGNLFKPGTLTGNATAFTQLKAGTPIYQTDYKNFAPSFGFAWTPGARQGWLNRWLGERGQTVLRGGYSLAYARNGSNEVRTALFGNPGVTVSVNRDVTQGNLGALPVLLRETARLAPPAFPNAPTYPMTGAPFVAVTNAANVYDPHLKIPTAQTWSFGIQREIAKDTALEIRYVGSRASRLWTIYNLNAVENNITENGLLNEFKLAQANLRANLAAGRGNTFAYTGAAGTAPLPITLAYLSGTPASGANATTNYTSTNFTNATLLNALALNSPNVCCSTTSYSAVLDNNATFRANALRAGLPANFMLTNPGLRGGANFTGNGGYTRYDSLQIEVRRRLSKGLLVQGNYQFAKAFAATRAVSNGTTTSTLRAPFINSLDTSTLRHAVKLNWIYELPFGRGKALLGRAGGILNRFVSGWEFDGTGRMQSGQLFNLGNVTLVGMTTKELQQVYQLRFDDKAKVAYMLPQDILDNTFKAFSTSATSATGYGSLGAPTGRYLAPASNSNCIQVYSGQCAPQNVFVTGPKFTRFDLSLVKHVKLTERIDFELRGEFLNAFNNANFLNLTGAANTNPANQTFGQVTTAFTDVFNTQDPGGRLGQIVVRINF